MLEIDLVPNAFALLDCFAKARGLVTNLKELNIRWEWKEDIEEHRFLLRGLKELFKCCGESLAGLRLIVSNSGNDVPSEIISDLS